MHISIEMHWHNSMERIHTEILFIRGHKIEKKIKRGLKIENKIQTSPDTSKRF